MRTRKRWKLKQRQQLPSKGSVKYLYKSKMEKKKKKSKAVRSEWSILSFSAAYCVYYTFKTGGRKKKVNTLENNPHNDTGTSKPRIIHSWQRKSCLINGAFLYYCYYYCLPVPHMHWNIWYHAAKWMLFTSSFNLFTSSGYWKSKATKNLRAHQ